MQIRRILVAAVIVAGVVAPTLSSVPGTAAAAPASSGKAKPKPVKTAKATPKKTVKPTPVKTVKPAKPVEFSASGVLTAVDVAGSTVTIAVKGGTTDVRGKTVTFTVTSKARVRLDETTSTVAGLQPGYRASISGTRIGTAYTVLKLNADTPEPTPSPTPSAPPTDAPVVEPTA